MIKQNPSVPTDRLEWIFTVTHCRKVLVTPSQGAQLEANPALPVPQPAQERDLQKARGDLKLPHQLMCSFPGCHNNLLIKKSLFIIMKPRSCPFGGHPSGAPCHPGHYLAMEAL